MNSSMHKVLSAQLVSKHNYRVTLFKLAWVVPVSTLAEVFGFQRLHFIRHCRDLGIPLPPRGYWNQVRAGRKVKRPPLPYSRDHVLVAQTRVALRALRADSRQIVCGTRGTYLDVRVSGSSLLRALKIYNQLVQLIEHRGGKVLLEDASGGWTRIQVGTFSFPFYISEHLPAVDYVEKKYLPRPKPSWRNDEQPSASFTYKRWETVPTGLLAVHCGTESWRDVGGSKLEAKITEIVDYMFSNKSTEPAA